MVPRMKCLFGLQIAIFAAYGMTCGKAFSDWSARREAAAFTDVLISMPLTSLTDFRI